MKTMLNLSILLMLIAGSAGAIDFYKLYSKGEIATLYEKKAVPVVHKVAYTPSVPAVAPTPAPTPTRIEDIELDAKYFSRSEEIYIDEELIEGEEVAETGEVETPTDINEVNGTAARDTPPTIKTPEVYQVAAAEYSNESMATDTTQK